jgi:isoleucyl-tRNA synthetase
MNENSKKSLNAEREEKILKFWQENETFKKSLEKEAPKGNYVFYDGPPFATGLPHYGHILGSTAKDVIGRYKTMQGFTVPRKWGWDCHGLPIENIVEKDLGISGKIGIEEFGVEAFVEHARSKVLTYVDEWKKTVDRMGRWVDFDHSYKTMDNTFIESVWWALGELNKKELLYEGVRVLAYCPRCETPIANSEIAMDNSYKDITDISVYVKFELVTSEEQKNSVALPSLRGRRLDENFSTLPTFLLAWTTTPWSLPGDTALAVNKDIKYIKILHEGAFYIVAEERVKFIPTLKDLELKENENFWHVDVKDLIGKSYTPPFNYYANTDMPNKENIWKIWHADFVTTEAGTGIAHEAPAFGEDDMNLAKANNIPFILHVTADGKFVDVVEDFKGEKVKSKEDHQSGDVLIIKYLAKEGLLFAKEKIIHSYPHCYRCETPLLYYALPSWFVNIQKVKKDILKEAKGMDWIPAHLKDGRFQNILENAPDWTISRNRYWASPLPIWKSKDGKIMFVNSLEDLKNKTKKSGNKYFIMRHGEGDHNVLGLCSGNADDPYHLTQHGAEQARLSAQKLKDEKIDIIIASPFVRTRETAEVVAEEIGFPKEKIVIAEEIRELKWGIYDKTPLADFMAVRDTYVALGNLEVKIPDGESFQDAKNRIGDFLYKLETQHQNKNILLVGHGILLEMSESVINGMNKEETTNEMKSVRFSPGELLGINFIPLPHNANYELDLHRPYIDRITLIDADGEEYTRIPEVIDCWFESGSMPFAQDHYPFERPNWQKENFPAGFVAEYIAQTRTWFYYSHVISTILFGKAPFEHVVTTGTVLATDGEKMSKSKNNFTDPWILFDKIGVDAIRFYLMSSQVMRGEDLNFSDKSVGEVASKIIGRLDNVVAFYELYRDKEIENKNYEQSQNVLDQWIIARMHQTIKEVTTHMESYDMALASRPFEGFIEDLSTWYLRRSRDRIKDADVGAKSTMYFVLKNLVKIMAPFTPFISEDVWQKLKGESDAESVHLALWPQVVELSFADEVKVIDSMTIARDIVTLGLEARQKAGIKVRQPLAKLLVNMEKLSTEYTEILQDELNVKNIEFIKGDENGVVLDTTITPELKKEGDYRELLRAVQDLRKVEGLNPSDVVVLYVHTEKEGKEIIEEFKADFMKTAGLSEIKMEKNSGLEVKVDELSFQIEIQK